MRGRTKAKGRVRGTKASLSATTKGVVRPSNRISVWQLTNSGGLNQDIEAADAGIDADLHLSILNTQPWRACLRCHPVEQHEARHDEWEYPVQRVTPGMRVTINGDEHLYAEYSRQKNQDDCLPS